MRLQAILLSACVGLALLALLLAGASQSALEAAGDVPEEAELNLAGAAYEMNMGPSGHLWISDLDASEIWQVNPATAAYTIYHGIPNPSDARRAPNGDVWWGDYLDGEFGRLDPTTGQATWWGVPDAYSLFGTQVDANNAFWVIAAAEPYLYRFQVGSGQLCTYTLPAQGASVYPQERDGLVWLGDEVNGRILRLDPTADEFTIWSLPADSAPLGLAFDVEGDLWYADPNNSVLGRFNPATGELRSYHPPTGLWPAMVVGRGSEIWYSEQNYGSIGRLVPAAASSVMTITHPSTAVAATSCRSETPAATATIATSNGTLTWITQTYPLLDDSNGWRIYGLPDGSYPWGVAIDENQFWFVDTGRQVLGRIPSTAPASVLACKVEDADGDDTSTGDQTPLQDWAIDLRIDGVAQGITQTTGVDGCTAWYGLDPGPAYGVQEELPEGWSALTPTSHDFGASNSGGSYSHTFVNTQDVSVSACKAEDEDGNEATTDDQTPIQNWAIDLRIDGVAQGITQTTGIDGCTTWNSLDPGPAYGVQEELPEGWLSLTGQIHDFPAAQSGDTLAYTFVNSQVVDVTACKLEDADGELSTEDDQTPVQDWTVYLVVGGSRQEPGVMTAADGCYTWDGLAPGETYGVEEALPSGWSALTPVSHDFGAAVSGGSYSYSFINTEAGYQIYIPHVTRGN